VPLKFTLSFADFTLPFVFYLVCTTFDFILEHQFFLFEKKKVFGLCDIKVILPVFVSLYPPTLCCFRPLYLSKSSAPHVQSVPQKTPLTSKWQCRSLRLEDALPPMSTTSIGPGLESQQPEFVNRIPDHECVQTSATITKKDRSQIAWGWMFWPDLHDNASKFTQIRWDFYPLQW
jgi:hypothetical protein